MSEKPDRAESDELSVSEKILRVQDLWDEIARAPDDVEPTSEQLEEAERRLAENDRSPDEYTTWEELKDRLEREK